jgi:hypothetical protein
VGDELISRAEIEALRFNVSDIAVALWTLLKLMRGDDDDEQG